MGSFHGGGDASHLVISNGLHLSTGLIIVLALIVLLELNAIFGKIGPMQTVKGVVHCSLALAVVFLALLQFV